MFNQENKQTLEAVFDMQNEMREDISEIKNILKSLTNCSPSIKKGIKGLAEILGSSLSTAAARLKSGTVPYTKHGSIYLFDEKEVREAMRNRRKKR